MSTASFGAIFLRRPLIEHSCSLSVVPITTPLLGSDRSRPYKDHEQVYPSKARSIYDD